jgi:GNAT superfamily N-acetyltransferase
LVSMPAGYESSVSTASDEQFVANGRWVTGVHHLERDDRHPTHLHVDLSDGSIVRIRRVTPDDRDALVKGFNRLSKQSRYTRFFTPMPTLSGPILDRLADLVGHRHVAIAAFSDGESDSGDTVEGRGSGLFCASDTGLGVARAIQETAGAPAELAVTVVDDVHGRGIGELLLRVLLAVMREMGVESFRASALRDNTAMLKTFSKLGAQVRTDPDDPTVKIVELSFAHLLPAEKWAPGFEAEVLSFARNLL